MGKKKADKRSIELWNKYQQTHRASKAMLENILEAVEEKGWRFFKSNTRAQKNMTDSVSAALANCYVLAEEKRDDFWLHIRTIPGIPANASLNYNDEKNLVTWGEK